MIRYVSVCSGIEAATVAWHPLGWRPIVFAEIAKFPSSVLAHHYPETPNVGDFTTLAAQSVRCDLLVGGTPCQSFSVAGLRGGLTDSRGNLALEFLRLAQRLEARWLLWENVPGVLSSNEGGDFGSLLGAMGELGYGFAYRVLDAQFFGVPQRRRRVFVVAHLGDWRRAATVLFEPPSVRGNSAARRATSKDVASTLTTRPGRRLDGEALTVTAVGGDIAHTLRGEGFDASEDGTGRGTPIIAFDTTQVTSRTNRSNPQPGDPCHPLTHTGAPPTIAFHHQQDPSSGRVSLAIGANSNDMGVLTQARARRLTPRECERLQGFPDDYTRIDGASDSARYKALGNSMAVPVMRWIGQRIDRADRNPA